MDMVRHMLSRDYQIHQLFVEPGDVGHSGLARARTYIFCSHKQTCAYLWDVFEMQEAIKDAMKGLVQTTPGDYMVSSDNMRTLLQHKICNSRKIQFQPATGNQ